MKRGTPLSLTFGLVLVIAGVAVMWTSPLASGGQLIGGPLIALAGMGVFGWAVASARATARRPATAAC